MSWRSALLACTGAAMHQACELEFCKLGKIQKMLAVWECGSRIIILIERRGQPLKIPSSAEPPATQLGGRSGGGASLRSS